MKNYKIILMLFSIIILTAFFLINSKPIQKNEEYLRIHIRANSNSQIDQNIKYQIKDKIVSYLIPFLSDCNSKEKAINIIENNLDNIEYIANKELKNAGFNYQSNAKICNEKFPTRSYSTLTLESGFYDALILNLGSGSGDNWWCVVYPPLCFVNNETQSISSLKSRIVEIIQYFKEKYI